MKTLKFIVQNETIVRDPSCDFTDLKKDSIVHAKFQFSKEWDGFARVVSFSRGNNEYNPQVLLRGYICEIPKEALNGSFFRMQVIGKNGPKKMETKDFIVMVNKNGGM